MLKSSVTYVPVTSVLFVVPSQGGNHYVSCNAVLLVVYCILQFLLTLSHVESFNSVLLIVYCILQFLFILSHVESFNSLLLIV